MHLASVASSVTAALNHLNGWIALGLIAALVFGETAVFLGFVLPGEAAARRPSACQRVADRPGRPLRGHGS